MVDTNKVLDDSATPLSLLSLLLSLSWPPSLVSLLLFPLLSVLHSFDTGMENPLVLPDVPDMTMDDLGREGNDPHVRQESWKMTKGVTLLELRWPPLHSVVALDLLLFIVAGVLAATMDGMSVRNREVSQVPGVDLAPVNGWVDHLGNRDR